MNLLLICCLIYFFPYAFLSFFVISRALMMILVLFSGKPYPRFVYQRLANFINADIMLPLNFIFNINRYHNFFNIHIRFPK